jgi:hypothetical protein
MVAHEPHEKHEKVNDRWVLNLKMAGLGAAFKPMPPPK